MQHTIYYFSGTGNSFYLAKNLAEQLGECELAPIVKARQQGRIVADTESVGFVFPVHFWGMPLLVQEFVSQLDLRQARYLFAVVNSGGEVGYTLTRLEQLLDVQSKQLNLGWNVTMPGNYIIPNYYRFIYSEGEKREAIFEKADEEIRMLAQTIRSNGSLMKKRHSAMTFFSKQVNKGFYSLYLKDLRSWDRHYRADEQCNNCGTCENLCPVNNIVMSDGKPQWRNACEQCMACIQACPRKAIHFKSQTAHKPRYMNPNVSLKELMSQSA